MSKTITISVDKETDVRLRRYAKNRYGKKKGALKRVIKEAVDSLISKDEQEKIRERSIKLLEKGISIKNGWKFDRDELHER